MAATPGIRVRHSRSCPAAKGGDCTKGRANGCEPSYEAFVFLARENKKVRKSFVTLAAAKQWRADATSARAKGALREPSKRTLREAGEAWIEGAEAGVILNRSGDRYKPSVLRGYRQALRDRIYEPLGAHRLSEIRRTDVQRLVNQLLADGLDPSTVRNAMLPLRVIFRDAIAAEEVEVNPTLELRLPAVRGKRDRIVPPNEAATLITALPESDRALWATAMFAGLRLGELRALRWEDVDLPGGLIRVERSWDQHAGVIEPKSRAGRRSVPIPSVLREYLISHKLRSGVNVGLAFGRAASNPFNPTTISGRAERAWSAADPKLDGLTLHECRHTYASLMIAAGVNAKALSTYMGHSSVMITLDRYGHLFRGNEEEAAGLLDAYLSRLRTVEG